jgi:hypothetical protein
MLCAFGGGGGAAANASPTAPRQVHNLSAIDLFTLARREEAAGNREAAIAIYNALSRDPSLDIRAEARFREAELLIAAKRYREAAVLLRSVLDDIPEASGVRLELARVLALMGDELAARRVLRQAEAGGLPPDVAGTVQQFSRALRSAQRFGGSLELGLAPDTNVNRATEARTLDTIIAPLTLSRDARARSGIGVKSVGGAFVRLPLTDDLSLLPRVSSVASAYGKSTYDDLSASALIGLEWRHGRDRLTPSAGFSWRRYGSRPYAHTATATLGWLHPVGSRAQLLTNASVSRVNYRVNHLQNGSIFDLRASYEWALTTTRGVSFGAAASRQTATDPGYATWSEGLSAEGWEEIGGTTAFLSLESRRLESDARLFLFTDKRREWFFSAQVGATFRQLKVKGFAPVVRLGWERNRSTVGLYDYKRLFGELGVTRAF